MIDKLLPCPFCGGDGKMIKENLYSRDHRNIHACWVECSICHAEGKHEVNRGAFDHRERAIKAWNTRAPIGDKNDR